MSAARRVVMPRNVQWHRVVIYGALVIFALFELAPTYVVLMTSLKDLDEIRRGNLLAPPEQWTIAAWLKAWGTACTGVRCDGLKPFFVNSVLIVIPAVALSSIVGALNGYVLSHWRFRGADAVFTILLVGFFIPYQAILLPAAQFLGFFNLA